MPAWITPEIEAASGATLLAISAATFVATRKSRGLAAETVIYATFVYGLITSLIGIGYGALS